MKACIFFIISVSLVSWSGFSQTTLDTYLSSGLDDTNNNDLLESLLKGEDALNLEYILNAGTLNAFSHYEPRKAYTGRKDVYHNTKLLTLLQIIADNAEKLENTEDFVRELRYILYESANYYISTQAIATYGTIIEKNRPTRSAVEGYSVEELFVVDIFDHLRYASVYASEEMSFSHTFRVSAPFIIRALERDNGIVDRAFYQSTLSYLGEFLTTQSTTKEMEQIYKTTFAIKLAK